MVIEKMNFLIGINTAYLSFIPNAGNSISIAMITVILFFILSGISIGIYCKAKMNKDNRMFFQRTGEQQYFESSSGNLPVSI